MESRHPSLPLSLHSKRAGAGARSPVGFDSSNSPRRKETERRRRGAPPPPVMLLEKKVEESFPLQLVEARRRRRRKKEREREREEGKGERDGRKAGRKKDLLFVLVEFLFGLLSARRKEDRVRESGKG